MTKEIIINSKNNTIEITKKFATSAKRYGTPEYEDLQNVRKDYPRYRVVVKSVSRKSDSFKGLTYDNMRDYILKHDDEEMKKEFYLLCGKNEDWSDKEFAETASYGEIKKWFLDKHEELSKQREKINEILNKKVA